MFSHYLLFDDVDIDNKFQCYCLYFILPISCFAGGLHLGQALVGIREKGRYANHRKELEALGVFAVVAKK